MAYEKPQLCILRLAGAAVRQSVDGMYPGDGVQDGKISTTHEAFTSDNGPLVTSSSSCAYQADE